jgi:hypothetical protein
MMTSAWGVDSCMLLSIREERPHRVKVHAAPLLIFSLVSIYKDTLWVHVGYKQLCLTHMSMYVRVGAMWPHPEPAWGVGELEASGCAASERQSCPHGSLVPTLTAGMSAQLFYFGFYLVWSSVMFLLLMLPLRLWGMLEYKSTSLVRYRLGKFRWKIGFIFYIYSKWVTCTSIYTRQRSSIIYPSYSANPSYRSTESNQVNISSAYIPLTIHIFFRKCLSQFESDVENGEWTAGWSGIAYETWKTTQKLRRQHKSPLARPSHLKARTLFWTGAKGSVKCYPYRQVFLLDPHCHSNM